MSITRVAIKYCGCCNPQVNVSAIAAHLAEAAARHGFEIAAEGPVDIKVALCGCPRACGRDESGAWHSVLVAGVSVQGKRVDESALPQALERELVRILEQVKEECKVSGEPRRGSRWH